MCRGSSLFLLLGALCSAEVLSSSADLACLGSALKEARFIFTGRVEGAEPGRLNVRVKRAVRGATVGRLTLRLPDKTRCTSPYPAYRPSVGDVKVFAASKSGVLVVPPLPMKLVTLDLVAAVIADISGESDLRRERNPRPAGKKKETPFEGWHGRRRRLKSCRTDRKDVKPRTND